MQRSPRPYCNIVLDPIAIGPRIYTRILIHRARGSEWEREGGGASVRETEREREREREQFIEERLPVALLILTQDSWPPMGFAIFRTICSKLEVKRGVFAPRQS